MIWIGTTAKNAGPNANLFLARLCIWNIQISQDVGTWKDYNEVFFFYNGYQFTYFPF